MVKPWGGARGRNDSIITHRALVTGARCLLTPVILTKVRIQKHAEPALKSMDPDFHQDDGAAAAFALQTLVFIHRVTRGVHRIADDLTACPSLGGVFAIVMIVKKTDQFRLAFRNRF